MQNTFALSIISLIFLLSTKGESQDFSIFVDHTDKLQIQSIESPICKAFADVNGDYRDDIIRSTNSGVVYVELNSDNGKEFQNFKLGRSVGDTWTIGIGDINNDGINEILSSGIYNGMTIWSSTDKMVGFSADTPTEANFFAQASNFVDINNDGWLDAFICNDDGLSKIFINDGNGELIDSSDFIDMTTAVPSNNSGNYSSEWTDVDGDGDLDLYIAKCRIGVNSFSDPRRINTLYINNNGTFTESAEDFSIAIGAQSWTSNFGDIDNDGDMDLFLINHDFRCQLFENINNSHFEEIETFVSGQELHTYGYQSAFYDFNNDGFLDILIGGEEDFLLLNDGNRNFVKNDNPFGFKDIVSFALGDANQDGFVDALVSYNAFTNNSGFGDKYFESIPNGNHFIGINLEGTTSNSSGIGARVELFGEWGVQTRIVQSGVGYGVTHSLRVHFGLDDATSIDSLRITWPSGLKDTYYNTEADKFYLAIENTCFEELNTINANTLLLDCINSTATLISSTQSPLIWSTGELNDTITVDEESIIFAQSNPEENCIIPSQTIVVNELSTPQIPSINVSDSILICNSEEVLFSTTESLPYQWSNGFEGRILRVEESGDYYTINSNYCDTVYSDTINVKFINSTYFTHPFIDTISSSQSLILNTSYDDVDWFSDSNANELIESDNSLTTGIIDSDTSFYFTTNVESKNPVYLGGENIKQTLSDGSVNLEAVSLTVGFNVKKNCILQSFKVNALLPGVRKFILQGLSNNQSNIELELFLDEGINEIFFNTELTPQDYFLSTDENVNIMNFGTSGPQLYLIEIENKYPYQIGDLASVNFTTLGFEYFGYSFDWKMTTENEVCTFGPFEYAIVYDPMSSVNTLSEDGAHIFPNPVYHSVQIKSDNLLNQCTLYNLLGAKVMECYPNDYKKIWHLEHLTDGIYTLVIKSNGKNQIQRIVKSSIK